MLAEYPPMMVEPQSLQSLRAEELREHTTCLMGVMSISEQAAGLAASDQPEFRQTFFLGPWPVRGRITYLDYDISGS